jgi:hypothetical protein
MDSQPLYCDDCDLEFSNLPSLRRHFLFKHIIVDMVPIGGKIEAEPEPEPAPVTKPKSRNLYVRGFDKGITDELLIEMFGQFGPITSATVRTYGITNESRGFGFVCFQNWKDAEKCIRESLLMTFRKKPAYVARLRVPADGPREDGAAESEVAQALRRKIEELQNGAVRGRLLTCIRRISEHQITKLIGDDQLFQRWVQLRGPEPERDPRS